MKDFTFKISTIFLIVALVIVTSCDNKDDKPSLSKQIAKTWVLTGAGYIKKDNVDLTSQYQNFSITFSSDGRYVATNSGHLLAPVGTWNEVDAKKFNLNADVQVEVIELTENALHIIFQVATQDVYTGGKISSTTGAYDVLLIAQN
jgi:hypothetical protein